MARQRRGGAQASTEQQKPDLGRARHQAEQKRKGTGKESVHWAVRRPGDDALGEVDGGVARPEGVGGEAHAARLAREGDEHLGADRRRKSPYQTQRSVET